MSLDKPLDFIHMGIVGITFINSNSDIVFTNITYLTDLYISGSSIVNIMNIDSNLFISNHSLLNNIISNTYTVLNNTYSNLLNTNTININNNNTTLTINNINVGNTILYNTGNTFSTLCTLNITTDNVITNIITSNSIVISSNIINIGTTDSNINIYAQTIDILSSETHINNDILTLNINNNTLQGFDVGNQSGIEILGSGSTGFIKTDILAQIFEIKCPNNLTTGNILNVDTNNNLIILGTTNIINNLIIKSSLYVSNISNLDNINVSNILYSNNNINTNNTSTSNSFLYINNKILCNNIINILYSDLIVNKDSVFNNSDISNISILDTGIFNNDTSINSLVYINDNIILNNTCINNDLIINKSTFINENLVVSDLNTQNDCIIIKDLIINSNLNLENINNNNISINSNLNILGNGVLSNNNILGSLDTSIAMLGRVVLSNNILEFDTNVLAEEAGIKIGCVYRNGDILKIKINLILPTMTLFGLNKISIQYDDIYIEPGVISFDYNRNILRSYIISIGTTIFSPPIEAIENTPLDLMTLINYSSGEYIILYQCEDIDGNIQTITRTLVILINVSGVIAEVYNHFNNYDTSITSDNKLLLKVNNSDINLTVSSILTQFDNYDTSITSDDKLLLKVDIVDMHQLLLDITNKFNDYDTSISSDNKLSNIYNRFNYYDTSIISDNKLSLKDNIIDIRSTVTSILNTIGSAGSISSSTGITITSTSAGGQLVIINNETDTNKNSEINFLRMGAYSNNQSAVGMGGTQSRGAFWWVNGEDRINIRTDMNLITITNDLIVTGIVYKYYKGTHSANITATLTVVQMLMVIVSNNTSNITLTLPTGNDTQLGMIGATSAVTLNQGFEWSIINTGTGVITLANNTNNTVIGNNIINLSASGKFYTVITQNLQAQTFRMS